ncbi:hypothetical protein BD560DRAFT_423937 [Blakeslea trispora]|nr:hypothetical protein BD560DRAFT_423937 [Blakeslea trispora]
MVQYYSKHVFETQNKNSLEKQRGVPRINSYHGDEAFITKEMLSSDCCAIAHLRFGYLKKFLACILTVPLIQNTSTISVYGFVPFIGEKETFSPDDAIHKIFSAVHLVYKSQGHEHVDTQEKIVSPFPCCHDAAYNMKVKRRRNDTDHKKLENKRMMIYTEKKEQRHIEESFSQIYTKMDRLLIE